MSRLSAFGSKCAFACRCAAVFAVLVLVGREACASGLLNNVSEAGGYTLIHEFSVPVGSSGWGGQPVPYTVDASAAISNGSFDRVAYYLELVKPTGETQWVYVSSSAFTTNATHLGIPRTYVLRYGAYEANAPSNATVRSNVSGITNTNGCNTINVEFWPSNYGASNGYGIPGASTTAFDFGDDGAGTSAGHGSMQIHNYGKGQTLFAYNNWGTFQTACALGIGNQVGGSGNPDWTFNSTNIANYTVRTLQVLVGSNYWAGVRSATNVTDSSGWMNGQVNTFGTNSDVYVFWGSSNGGSTPALWANSALVGSYTNSGIGVTRQVTGLAGGTTTWYTYMVSNAVKTVWASPTNFVTAAAPAVANGGAAVSAGQAVLRGWLTSGGTADVYIYWGRTDGGVSSAYDNVIKLTDVGQGLFTANITGFCGFDYHYVCFASNAVGTAWAASSKSFKFPAVATGFNYAPGLRGSLFQPTPDTQPPVDLNGASYVESLSRIPTGSKTNTVLAMSEVAGKNIVLTGPANTWNEFGGSPGDHFVAALSGRFYPTVSGIYNFRWSQDDRGWMFIDVGNDGVFDYSDAVGTWAWDSNGNKTLTAGQGYNFVLFSQDMAGGDSLSFMYTPPGTTELTVNPSTQPGQWRYPSSVAPVLSVANDGVSGVTDHSATLKAVLSARNWACDVFACWGRTDGGTAAASWETNAYVGRFENWAGAVSLPVDGLTANATYYYTFYVTNDLANAWATPSQAFVPGAVTIAATDDSASESGDAGSFRVTRPSGATGGALTVYYTLSGTAVSGSDYAALSGSVTIPDGAASADIAVAPLADVNWQEGDETVTATLAAGNYAVGAPSAATVTIHDAGSTADDWFLRMPIRFAGYNRPEVLTNFPALVTLDTGLAGFSYDQFLSGANGDLRFADASLSRELPYEIERWSPGGQSRVWVQVPRLTNNATIWMLWHKSGLTAPAYTTNGAVWSEGYVTVAHLSETTGTVMDSTANRNNGILTGFPLQNAAGAIAGGVQFDGMDDMIAFGTANRPTNNFTFSAWVKASVNHEIDVETNAATAGTAGQRFAFDAEQVAVHAGAGLSVGTNGLSVYEHSPSYMPPLAVYSSDIGAGWNYVAVTYTNKVPFIYLNGRMVRTAFASTRPTVYAPYRIGGQFNGYGYFNGLMDEVRISSVTRSSNWLWAAYMTMASNGVLTTYGAYQTAGHPDVANLSASDVTAASVTLNGYLSATGMAETAVAVYWGTTDGGTDAAAWANTNWFAVPAAPGALSTAISGLASGTAYFFRFAATNAFGTVWASSSDALLTGAVTLEATDAAAAEDPLDTGAFTVSRGGAYDAPLTVGYTLSGTAANGVDMASLSGTVTIPAGAASATITVTPLFNRNYQVRATDTVTLALASGAYLAGSPASGTVTISNWQPSTASGFDVPRNFLSATADPLTGSETLSKTGAGQMMFVGSSGNTFKGDIAVDTDSGTLRIGGIPGMTTGSGSTLPNMTAANTITVKRGGQLYIDDNGTYSAVSSVPNRFGSEGNRPAVVLNGGLLTLNGGSTNVTVQQNLGALSLSSGFSTITVNRNSGTPELVFTGVSQAKGSHVNFAGTSLGLYSNAPRVRFTSPPVLTGSGGPAGTTTMSLMPGARWTGDMVTHDGITGVRPLATAEYSAVSGNDVNTAGTGDNVKLANSSPAAFPPLLANKVINSLDINVNASASWAPTNKLTLTSGQLISGVQNQQMVINYPSTLTAGSGTSDASLDVTVLNNTTYIRSLITDNGSGKITLTKNGGSSLTLDGNVDNTYSGGTYINEGTLNTGSTAARRYLGAGPVRVDAGVLSLGQVGATANASGDDYTAVNGGQIQLATATYPIDDTFNIGPGCVILGAWSMPGLSLNSLDRGIDVPGATPNITLASDAIIAHNFSLSAPLNLTNNTVRNLGTGCDLYYGVVADQANAAGAITIGKGTAFKGVATDRSDRRWAVGTINVTPGTDEIFLQGMVRPGASPCQLYLGNWLIAGGTVIAPAGPLTANVIGTLILDDYDSTFGDTSAGKPVTFAVGSGATINANKPNSMGAGSGVASIVVKDGGTLQFGVHSAVNGSVTVQAGGKLLANNAGGMTGSGTITMSSGSILELTAATGLTGVQADALAASLLPGQLIRIYAGNFGSPSDTLDSHVGSKAPIYELYANNYAAANPLVNGTTVMTLNRDAATGLGGMLVNDWSGRTLAAAANGVLVIGPNGGTIAATSNTTLEVQQRFSLGANALTIGATNMLDRMLLPKLGTVYLSAALGLNTASAGSSVTVIPGATLQVAANAVPDEPDVTVNGTLLLSGSETLGSLGGSGGVNLQGNILTVGRNNNASTFSGVLTNSTLTASLVKTGSGRMDITSRQDFFTGGVTVNGGTLALSGSGAMSNVVASALSLIGNGTLLLDNSVVNSRDRLAGQAGVTFNGGTLRFVGKDGEAAGESLGAALFANGAATIDVVNGSGAGSSVDLDFAGIAPTVGSVKFTASNGTLGAAGDNPRVFFDGLSAGLMSFATVGGAPAYYDAVTGVRAFALSEGTEFDGTADQTGVDTKYTALNNHLALTTARSVNSLWIDSPGAGCAVNLGSAGPNTLTLASGRLQLTGSDDFSITRSGSSSGVLTRDANATLFLGVDAGRTLSVGVPVANGLGSVEKDGAGTLVLGAANTFAGVLSINEGTVRYGSIASSDLNNNNVNIWNSGVLDFAGDTDTLNTLSIYSGGVTNSVANGALTVAQLTMGGGPAGSSSYVQSGTGSLKLNGQGLTFNAANDPNMATIGGKLDLNGSGRTFQVNNSVAPGAAVDLDITATVIGGASYSITKSGTGVMRLSSSNSFDGALYISDGSGTVIASHPQALGNPTAGRALTVGSSCSLVFDGSKGNITVPALYTNVFLNGAGDYLIGPIRGELVNWSGTNTVPSTVSLLSGSYIASLGGKLVLSGMITNLQDLSVYGGGDTELSGPILTGARALNKNGAGTLTLSGTATNLFSGITTVNAGTLLLAKANGTTPVNAIGDGVLTVNNGATLRYATGSANPDMIGTNVINVYGAGQLDFNGSSDVVGPVNVSSSGAVTDTTPITNSAAGGTWTVNPLSITPAPGYLTRITSGSGTLALAGTNLFFYTANNGRGRISGNLSLGSASRYFTVNQGLHPDYDLAVDAVISGAVGSGIIHDSVGTTYGGVLRLEGANTFDGNVTINDGNKGTIVLANNQALGVPSAARTVWVGTGGSLALDGGISVSDPAGRLDVVLRGTGDSRLAGMNGAGASQSGALFSMSGTNTLPCRITLSNATQIASSKRLVLQNMLIGQNLALTVVGPGETAFAVNGMVTNVSSITLGSNATLSLENSAAANKADRIINTIPLALNGGNVRFVSDSGAAHFSEALGAVTVNMGTNSFYASQAAVGYTSALVVASITRVSGTVDFVGTGLGEDARNRIFITGQADGMIGPWATINGTNLAMYSSARGVYAGSGVEYGVAALGGTAASVIPDDSSASAVINTMGSMGPITVANVWTNRILEVRQATEYASTVQMVQGVTNRTLQTSRLSIGAEKSSLTIGENDNDGALMALSSGSTLSLENLNPSASLAVKSAVQNNGASTALAKFGMGPVVLSGSNSYVGATLVSEGSLEFGGTLAQKLAGVISGAGTLIKSGTNQLHLYAANTFTGPMYVNGGTVRPESNAAFGSSVSGTFIASGATLDVGCDRSVGGTRFNDNLNLGAEEFTISGAGVGSMGAIINNGASNQMSAVQRVVLSGDATLGGNMRWDIRSGYLYLNDHTLMKTGGNEIAIVSIPLNPGSGHVVVNQGLLRFESSLLVNGTAANTATVNRGAKLELYVLSPYVPRWSLILNDGAYFNGAAAGATATNVNIWAGPVTLNGTVNLYGTIGGVQHTILGSISGPGTLVKNGNSTSTLWLMATNNTYAGGTIVSNGTLYARFATSLPGSNAVVAGATLAVHASDGTFGFTGEQLRSLNLATAFLGNTAYLSIDTAYASLECAGDLPRSMGLIKLGTNSLSLARNAVLGNVASYDGALSFGGNNVVSGNLAVVCGKATLTGTNTFIGTGDIYFGSSSTSNGTFTIGPNGRLTCNAGFRISTANGSGALYLNGGSFSNTVGVGDMNFVFGRETNSYGYFRMTGGNVVAGRFQTAGNGDNTSRARGVARISGGTLTFSEHVLLARNVGCESVVTLEGGTINHTVGNELSLARQGGRSELNICGGTFNNASMNTIFQPTTGFGPGTGIVNLCSGSLITAPFLNANGAPATLNFLGGTLAPSGDSTVFVPGTVSNVYTFGATGSFAGGAVIDSNGRAIAIPAVIRNPTGQGVSAITLSNAGSGYIGEPYVSIEGGSGTGATAVANMVDDGTGRGTFAVGTVTITCPGVGYAATPTVLFKGGGFNIVTAQVGTVTLADNKGGGLTKIGAGTLTLAAANTYTGTTTIAAGTLKLGTAAALMPNTPIVLAGGTLDLGGFTVTNLVSGMGTISNGTFATVLSPNGPGALGTNALALGKSTVLTGTYEADVTADGRCDLVSVQGNIDLSGLDLRVVDTDALDRGRAYTILTCTGSRTGAFKSTNLADKRWHVSYRSDGSVQLVFVNGTLIRLR